MAKIESIFKHKKQNDVVEEKKEETMEWFDKEGNKITITKSKWKAEVLPEMLDRHWDKDDELCSIIVDVMQMGFFEEVKKAAEHLMEIDHIEERATTILGMNYMLCDLDDEAENVLNRYLEKNPNSSIVLTNLAKVYLRRDQKDRALETLLKAININPDEGNAIDVYLLVVKTDEGEEGYNKALETLAKIEGCNYAKLLIAREHLDKREFSKAKRIYDEVLEKSSEDSNVLSIISGDLGRHGYVKELIKITEPLYKINIHGERPGLNLLNAYYQTRNYRKGQAMIRELFAFPDAQLRDYLSHMNAEFEKMKNIKEVPLKRGKSKVTMIVLDKPIWYYELYSPSFLMPKKRGAKKIALLPYVDLTKKDQPEGEVQVRADGVGTLSRTIPLYMGEIITYNTKYAQNVVVPFAEGYGPIVSDEEYTEEALRELCKKAGTEKLVSGSITLKNTTLVIRNYIYDSLTDKVETIIYDVDEECFGEDLNDMVRDVVGHFEYKESEDGLYKLSSNEEVPAYLSSLGQLLTQTFVNSRYLDRSLILDGEKVMYNWYMNMILNNQDSELNKLILISAIAKSKSYGSEIYKSIKNQAIGLLENHKDERYSKSLLPLVYKLYDMEDEFKASINRAKENSKDAEYLKWIDRIAAKDEVAATE